MQKIISLLLKRTMAILVVVSFLLQPISVLAESQTAAPASTDTDAQSIESVTLVTGESGAVSGNTMATADEKGGTKNVKTSGDGSDFHKQEGLMQGDKKNIKTSGQFLVDNFSGAATYSYQFELPAGRGGASPQLGLNYNSHNIVQSDSIVGAGWSLTQSNITRQNKAGVMNIYSANDYVLQLFGEQIELVVKNLGQGEFGVKVENDYLSINKINNVWEVKDKSGNLYVFGDDSSTRQTDPSNQQNIYRWWLKKVIDTNGNQITYDYFSDSNQLYPRSINYSSNGGSAGEYEVRFQPFYNVPTAADIRPDDSFSYVSQFKISTKYTLKNIEIFHDSVKKSNYVLNYIMGQNG